MTLTLVSEQSNKKWYVTLIREMVTQGCENWTLSVRDINSLLLLERHVLRRMRGPVQAKK